MRGTESISIQEMKSNRLAAQVKTEPWFTIQNTIWSCWWLDLEATTAKPRFTRYATVTNALGSPVLVDSHNLQSQPGYGRSYELFVTSNNGFLSCRHINACSTFTANPILPLNGRWHCPSRGAAQRRPQRGPGRFGSTA